MAARGPYCAPDDRLQPPPTDPAEELRNIERALGGIYSSIADMLYDAAVLSNPSAFALTAKPRPIPYTTGAVGVSAYKNTLQDKAVLVHCRAQDDGSGAEVDMFAAVDSALTTNDQASVSKRSKQPSIDVLVPPGGEVFVAASSPLGAGIIVNIVVCVIPLKGVYGGSN